VRVKVSARISEKEFQGQVLDLAKLSDWPEIEEVLRRRQRGAVVDEG
jgi:hypothetical protein